MAGAHVPPASTIQEFSGILYMFSYLEYSLKYSELFIENYEFSKKLIRMLTEKVL